jgi:carboxypeptidase PM20D1
MRLEHKETIEVPIPHSVGENPAHRLGAALRFHTVSTPEPAGPSAEAFRELHAFLEKEFPRAHDELKKELINKFTLLFTWEGSDPELDPVLLMAHQDVVPVDPETEAEWIYPPFSGKVAEGFVWGRGALDVKSGMMGILEAVEILLGEGFRPRRTVLLAFGHDEEIGGTQGAARVAETLRSRNVRLEYVLDEGGGLLEGVIPGVSRPVALVGIAEKGYLSLELTVSAIGGHSSLPPKSTATGILSRALVRLEEGVFPARTHFLEGMFKPLLPGMSLTQRVVFANLWLLRPLVARAMCKYPKMNAEIRTTAAVTLLRGGVKENVVPEKVSALVNFRIMPGETVASVMERARKIIADDRVGIKAQDNAIEPSPVTEVQSGAYALLVKTIRQAAREKTLAVAPYLVTGGTDSRYFAGLSGNVFRFLFNRMKKEDLARLHGCNERISVENYLQAIEFYRFLLKNSQELS